MSTLRDEIIKLANENPDGIRAHLVPLLRKEAIGMPSYSNTLIGVQWTIEETEDDYEQGEIGRSKIVQSKFNFGTFKNPQEMIKALAQQTGCPTNSKNWYIATTYPGTIECSWQVDDQHTEPSRQQIEQWKRGEVKLYDSRLIVHFQRGRIYSPDTKEIKLLFPQFDVN